MSEKEVPTGANKRFLVTCNSNPFAGFDEQKDADTYVKMMKSCIKGGKGNVMAACANMTWDVKDRGVNFKG